MVPSTSRDISTLERVKLAKHWKSTKNSLLWPRSSKKMNWKVVIVMMSSVLKFRQSTTKAIVISTTAIISTINLWISTFLSWVWPKSLLLNLTMSKTRLLIPSVMPRFNYTAWSTTMRLHHKLVWAQARPWSAKMRKSAKRPTYNTLWRCASNSNSRTRYLWTPSQVMTHKWFKAYPRPFASFRAQQRQSFMTNSPILTISNLSTKVVMVSQTPQTWSGLQ